MAVAQGINKTLAYKAQAGLGSAASGSGGQRLRRRTANFNLTRDTYENDEIVSHQQSTGATAGVKRGSGRLSGLLSPATYKDLIAAGLRKVFAATSNITSLSLTIAGSGPYTITRGSGDFLTGGIKVGDIVRITAGSVDALNSNKNLLVLSLTDTVLTVTPLNGSAMTAEGPIASCTIAVPGKKCWAPTTSHTNTYFTFEEWYSDLSKSELATDVQVGQMQIALPATGNATIDFDFVGLNRTRSGSQVLTTPTAETTTSVLTAVNGKVIVGTTVTPITGAQITINPNVSPGEAEVGSNAISDVVRGRIAVSGQITAKFSSVALQDIFDDQSTTALVLTVAADGTAGSEFVTFVMSKIKIMGDDANDGEAQEIIRTYPFTAEINGSGGAALANHQTILSIQDSAA